MKFYTGTKSRDDYYEIKGYISIVYCLFIHNTVVKYKMVLLCIVNEAFKESRIQSATLMIFTCEIMLGMGRNETLVMQLDRDGRAPLVIEDHWLEDVHDSVLLGSLVTKVNGIQKLPKSIKSHIAITHWLS